MRTQRVLIILAALFLAAVSFAQDRASITGTITDATGSLVPGAHVQLKCPATGLTRETISGGAGIYEFASLPVGTYQVAISATGFQQFTVSDITLLFGEVRTVDVRLAVGMASEKVDVVG